MNPRLALSVLAALCLLSLWLSPWADINREVGARGTVVLLPNRVIDFTGRTEAIDIPGQYLTLGLLSTALLALLASVKLSWRSCRLLWCLAGITLIAASFYGQQGVHSATQQAQRQELLAIIIDSVSNPGATTDIAALNAVTADIDNRSIEASANAARSAGARVRRLPYSSANIGFAAFLSLLTGAFALLMSARGLPWLRRWLDRSVRVIALPAVSIGLALLAAAVVILALQETPRGSNVAIEGVGMYLAGRFDTLWYAYLILFAGSLSSLAGFLNALQLATPLIFTGLAVAFSFRAGLFNIGAPGQMVLGAIFAMLVGLYVPGPRLLVIPLAVGAAALGGGLWGGLAGWLKARFGANEVINTILLNYIAASLLLFVLSSSHTFAAGAWRALLGILAFVLLSVLLLVLRPLRQLLLQRPRVSAAFTWLALIAIMLIAGAPRPNDSPVTLNLPFKAPGSELRSHPLNPQARLPQLPQSLGIDLRANPGTNVVALDYRWPVAALAALLAFGLSAALARNIKVRLFIALLAAAVGFGLAQALGWQALDTAIPPTQLNAAFLIALGAAVFVQLLLWHTKWGYELRAVGLSPQAAEYGGANIANNTVLTMTLSGALAGLSACHYVLGGALEEYALRQALPTNDGFDGIAVALLGANTPLGVVLAALLFGVLRNGGALLNITFSSLTRDVVSMILALVVLFIAARGFLPERFFRPSSLADDPPTSGDPQEQQAIDQQAATEAERPSKALQPSREGM